MINLLGDGKNQVRTLSTDREAGKKRTSSGSSTSPPSFLPSVDPDFQNVQEALSVILDVQGGFLDTAEVYGNGESEVRTREGRRKASEG